jgi:hypothetical protein
MLARRVGDPAANVDQLQERFERRRTNTTADVAGSPTLLARASNARQPAVLNILCAVGGLGR